MGRSENVGNACLYLKLMLKVFCLRSYSLVSFENSLRITRSFI